MQIDSEKLKEILETRKSELEDMADVEFNREQKLIYMGQNLGLAFVLKAVKSLENQ